MVRLADLTEEERRSLLEYECPQFQIDAYVAGPPLAERRVALMTTAGLRRSSDRPFAVNSVDYRLLPVEHRDELVMDHISSGFDRTGFAQDLEVVLPLGRLAELAAAGVVGSVADLHYSFMGAGDVHAMRTPVRQIARALHADGVDAVVLSPV